MDILQTALFKKQTKKLFPSQKYDLNKAITTIVNNPLSGELKKGDLRGIRVYKFSMTHQLTLLAYTFVEDKLQLLLLAVGAHENFYRDLKQ